MNTSRAHTAPLSPSPLAYTTRLPALCRHLHRLEQISAPNKYPGSRPLSRWPTYNTSASVRNRSTHVRTKNTIFDIFSYIRMYYMQGWYIEAPRKWYVCKNKALNLNLNTNPHYTHVHMYACVCTYMYACIYIRVLHTYIGSYSSFSRFKGQALIPTPYFTIPNMYIHYMCVYVRKYVHSPWKYIAPPGSTPKLPLDGLCVRVCKTGTCIHTYVI